MRTVLIRIGRRRPPDGYTVSLYAEGDHCESWHQTPLAEAVIPDDLYLEELAELRIGPDDDIVDALRDHVLIGPDRPGAASVIGQYLYAVVARGDVKREWDLLARADARFLLHVEDPGLQMLPWELMQRGPGFVFNNPVRPWARVEDGVRLDGPVEPASGHDRYPLRLLIVVASEAGDAGLQAEEEVYAIVQGVRGSAVPVDWHVERRPASEELRELLRWFRPHMLHFIGHSAGGDLLIDRRLKSRYDTESGEEYWISGPRTDGRDRLKGETLPVEIDADVRVEYWTEIRGQPERAAETVANR